MDGDPVRGAFSSIRAAIDELNAAALWSRSNNAALDDARECFALLQSLESVRLAMVADLESRALPNGLTTKAFLKSALRRTTGQASADVRAAMNRLPQVAEAFAAGEISREHLDVVVKTLGKIPEEVRYREMPDDPSVPIIEAVDAFFAERARQYDSYQLQCLARALLAALMPDDDDGFDPYAYDRRQESHARDETGMLHGTFALDAPNGADFAAAVDHFSAPVAARVERADDGSDVVVRDTRSAAQRRADALGLIARLAMGAAEAGTKAGEPPRLVLYTGIEDYHDLHCSDPAHATPPAAEPPAPQPPAPQQPASQPPAPQQPTPEPAAPQPPASGPTAPERSMPEPSVPGSSAPPAPQPTATQSRTSEPLASAPPMPEGPALPTEPPVPPGPPGPGGAQRRQGRVHGATDTHLGAIGPALLARFACDAVLQTALMHPTGAVLDLGRDARTISPAQRRALTARDRGCVIPGCSAPAAWCDGHHVNYWSRGGLTNLDELVLVCGQHHSAVHLGLWELRMRDGLPWARPRRSWTRYGDGSGTRTTSTWTTRGPSASVRALRG